MRRYPENDRRQNRRALRSAQADIKQIKHTHQSRHSERAEQVHKENFNFSAPAPCGLAYERSFERPDPGVRAAPAKKFVYFLARDIERNGENGLTDAVLRVIPAVGPHRRVYLACNRKVPALPQGSSLLKNLHFIGRIEMTARQRDVERQEAGKEPDRDFSIGLRRTGMHAVVRPDF